MRILFVLIIFFVIGCKKDEQSPTPIPDLTSQYLGEWNFSESYYRAGMNGIYFDSLNHISIIENTDKIEIKPSQIDLNKEINKIGSYEAKINLHAEILANIHIEVVKEKEEN